jgi:solute:Na+ symporter, SSS family
MLNSIRTADLVVIILYMLGTAGIGLYFARKNNNTDEFFLGGRNFPGWAIGLSMIGTSISSVTFLALPAAAYVLDWRQSTPYLVLPFTCTLAVIFFIPIFRKGKITSAYQYLEARFGRPARLYGAICFLIGETIRLGVVLFLVAIPISLMTGVNINLVIVVAGLFIALYTVIGGIDAVIWTDVIQSIVLWIGGLFVIFFLCWKIPGGFTQVIDTGMQFNKFSFGPMTFDLAKRTFPVLLFLGMFNWLGMYAANQNVVQRYLAAKNTREARKATIICAAGSLPTWFAFYFVGTCLFVYFRFFPNPEVAKMSADQVFPYYIINSLPAGISGLIIAGVLAAAMSSLDSSMNSFSSICTMDILRGFIVKDKPDTYYMRWARIFSLAAMFIMIGGAMVFANVPKESMVDLGYIIGGLLIMFVLSFFFLGFFVPRVSNRSLWLGFLCGSVANIYLLISYFGLLPDAITPPVHVYWFKVVCQTVMIASAVIISYLWPESKRNLDGLTAFNILKKSASTE